MHWLTNWFIRNPVAANLIMVLILVGGAFSLSQLRIEGFPKVPADTVTVSTAFPGAYTQQVDEQITRKLERSLEGLAGVKQTTSSSVDGFSSISVKMKEGYSLERLIDDVLTRVGSAYNLPQEAEKPIITRNEFNLSALIVQIYGDSDQLSLQYIGRMLREKLLAQPEISKLNLWGQRKSEVSIDVSEQAMRKYDLTLSEITQRIRSSSLRFKAGSLKTKGGNIAIRADEQAYFYQDFASIPVMEKPDGTQLLLKDVANISDGLEDDDVEVRFNGLPAIGMEVQIGRSENLLTISKVVRRVIKEMQPGLPQGIKLDIWADTSGYITERLDLLKTNAFQGLLLVLVLLSLFLNLRLAFWVAMGVPISVMGAVAVMGHPVLDYSLNDVTTFGFIIALGILVDDAVVVGESVYSEREKIADPVKGTEKGVARVATATIYGVLTTIAAFYPMLLIDNALGKVLASFAGVVILALLFSLFESKFILPSHLAHTSIKPLNGSNFLSRGWKKAQDVCQGTLQKFNQKVYRPTLIWCLEQRYAVLMLFSAVAIAGIGLMSTGKIRTTFFPDIPGQTITVNMTMDTRAPYPMTLANADHIEKIAEQLNRTYQATYQLDTPPIKHILVAVQGAYSMEIYAELTKAEQRPGLGTMRIVNDWREQTGILEGIERLTFAGSEETGGGFAIEVQSKEIDSLRPVFESLMATLTQIEGVSSVRDSLKAGKPELYLKLKPKARHLGFTTASLARQIGYRFGGAEAQRIQRNGEEVRVMVRGSKEVRNSLRDLMQTQVRSEKGNWIPLLSVADVHSAYVNDYIERRNGNITSTIFANIDKGVTSPSEVFARLQQEKIPALGQQYPLVEVKGIGELEQMGEIKGGLVKALIFTCILIYVLLAIPLKSYYQPFVIMSVIPLGFMGAAFGHIIAGIPVSLLSFFGMLALAGVVVNDSLVMITRYNEARDEVGVHQALIEAGTSRMRPIFLTTVTTVAGLMPLMNETSEQAQYLIPAAVSLAYGEIFATLIMLLLVPVILAIGHDVNQWFSGQKQSASSMTEPS